MSAPLLLALAAFCAFAGLAWLALAMDVHWEHVHAGVTPPARTRRKLRALGAAGISGSALLCALADTPAMALLVWVMLLAVAALLVLCALAWRPRWLRALWPAARQ